MRKKKRVLRYKAKLKRWSGYGAYLKSKCQICETESLFFYDRFDAVCCLNCDEWMDKACSNPDCPYCSRRPATPSEALFYDKERYDGKKEWRRSNYQHKNNGRIRHIQRKELYKDINLNKYDS